MRVELFREEERDTEEGSMERRSRSTGYRVEDVEGGVCED